MTLKQFYDFVLVELNKTAAGVLLLEDFNYFANKAVNQRTNKSYNVYDMNQQTTDDLRVLKATALLKATEVIKEPGVGATEDEKAKYAICGGSFEVMLPDDYLHLLGCVCNYEVLKTFKCYDKGDYFQQGAKRLTSDMWPQIINNYYLRPTYKNPYYFIHNVNTSDNLPTNPQTDTQKRVDIKDTGGATTKTVIAFGASSTDALYKENDIEQTATVRYNNPSKVRMEIRYGKDASVFKLVNVAVDYIKAPQELRLTQKQLDSVEDISQMLEFPDNVCQEIINEMVTLCLENSSDPRLQTQIPISQSVASPSPQQQQTKK